jgi:hypothetical protein
MDLVLQVNAKTTSVKAITVNGKPTKWINVDDAIKIPALKLNCGEAVKYQIEIVWNSSKMASETQRPVYNAHNQPIQYDPQGILTMADNAVTYGDHTYFVKVTQGNFTWWMPVDKDHKPALQIIASEQASSRLKFKIQANTVTILKGKVIVNPGPNQYTVDRSIPMGSQSDLIEVPANNLILGTNVIQVQTPKETFNLTITNWNIQKEIPRQETINLTPYYNDLVTNIFKNKYLSPRPASPTLQLPWQGIGNWCYPLIEANIDDSGLRKAAGDKNIFTTSQNIGFATPGKTGDKNILFTSQWDNYPKRAIIPLTGRASHAYFLMAGSTNPMQSRITNGEIIIHYNDNSTYVLELKNPQTWWPIEQDYEDDGYAFQLNAARPIRVYLKSGIATTMFNDFKPIKGFANRGIDGGAGTILDLPLNPDKELRSLELRTIANDVVIGLMSVTLVRN